MQVTLASPAPGTHSQQRREERKCGALEAPALVGKVAQPPTPL